MSEQLALDPVRFYLKEIGRVDLLSARKEIALAKKIQAGVLASERLEAIEKGEQVVDRKEKRKLVRDEQMGIDAKNEMILANLRLVVSIAKRYVGRGLPFQDLVQEGNTGLIRAVEKFDHTLGFKFSTYATWWIRQAVTRAIADQGRTIRVPVHMVETINKLNRVEKELTKTLGRTPNDEELANEMGMTEARILEIKTIRQDPVSLETPVGEEDDSVLGDFVADENAKDPVGETEKVFMAEEIQKMMSCLAEREREVLVLRYGLKDGRQRTLEEVGREFSVTRERIRQIESKALHKLRLPGRSGHLAEFLE